jgi:DNA-binding transcriptional MocR family regulator
MRVARQIKGQRSSEIADSIEHLIRTGKFGTGDRLPSVRELASSLGVSPGTVAASYKGLQDRALLVGRGRQGTRVTERPPLSVPATVSVPAGVRDLATGNPDPNLLPPLRPVLDRIEPGHLLYGEPLSEPRLVEVAQNQFEADGIPAVIVGSALDGIERVLMTQPDLRPGDKIAVEDPCFPGVLDLIPATTLVPEPVRVDDDGPLPVDVERALKRGCRALILTPRAQSPTGAVLQERRVRELRRILRAGPEVLVIEDDHAGPVSGFPAVTLVGPDVPRWVVIRSTGKSLGPDLRLGFMAGDAITVARVEGRRSLGAGWVSHILQRVVLGLLTDRKTQTLLRKAADVYASRRSAMIEALAARGIRASGRSGLNVWVPVRDEHRTVQTLLDAGFAIRSGERFRIASPPGVRITIASIDPKEADAVAGLVATSLEFKRRTRPA